MKETKKTITDCRKCNRAVYTTDVDAKGMCCYCGGRDPLGREVVETTKPGDEHRTYDLVNPKKRGIKKS